MEQGLVTVCFDFEMDLAQSHQISVKQVWNRSPEVTRVPVEMDLCYSKTRFQETCQKNPKNSADCFSMRFSRVSNEHIYFQQQWDQVDGVQERLNSSGWEIAWSWANRPLGFSVTQQDLLAIARLRYSRHLQRFELSQTFWGICNKGFDCAVSKSLIFPHPKSGWWKTVKNPGISLQYESFDRVKAGPVSGYMSFSMAILT